MERWINSERVPVYSPITDFLYDLPRWDGKDCIRRWPATYVSCDESAVSELKRYASFIATSNHSDLLSDPSGSRRFICINITGRIRNDAAINYLQLYAQVAQELREGECFYFSPEEEAVLMENNQEFELQTGWTALSTVFPLCR